MPMCGSAVTARPSIPTAAESRLYQEGAAIEEAAYRPPDSQFSQHCMRSGCSRWNIARRGFRQQQQQPIQRLNIIQVPDCRKS
jgi:hypothetical protein